MKPSCPVPTRLLRLSAVAATTTPAKRSRLNISVVIMKGHVTVTYAAGEPADLHKMPCTVFVALAGSSDAGRFSDRAGCRVAV